MLSEKEKSRLFVKEYLKPYPFVKEKDNDQVYAKIIKINEIQNRNRIFFEISLVNKYMLQTDSAYFNQDYVNQELYQIYKPYYYEFSADVNLDLDMDMDIQKWRELEKNGWFEAVLIETVDKENRNCLNGILEFSASPFKEKQFGLEYSCEVSETLKNELEGTYGIPVTKDSTSISNIKDEMGKVFDSFKRIEAKIYNVGQANCIYLHVDRKKRVLFDVGVTKRSGTCSEDRKERQVQYSMASIGKMLPSMVILSHWDIDHIKGAFLLKSQAFSKIWIAPELDKRNSISVKRIAKYLLKNKKILFVLKSYCGIEIFRNKSEKIYLYCGSGRNEPHGPNAKNNRGLILVVKGKDGNTIFPGDCAYSAWPEDIELKENKNLVVPHHGSRMDLNRLLDSKVKKGCGRKNAYISVGMDARLENWDHPNNGHIEALEKCGYEVHITIRSDGYKIFI